MSFVWDYQMIKVAQEDDEEIGLIAEVFYDDNGKPTAFVKADLLSIAELERAHKDIQKQGGSLNTFFWDNGSFTCRIDGDEDAFTHHYLWTPHT